MPVANSAKQPMDLTPMGQAAAMKLIDRYLSGFPYLSLTDPEGYQAALAEMMQRYPKWAGEYAIRRPNKDAPNMPASELLLKTWLEELVAPHRSLTKWNEKASEQLEERKLLESHIPKQTFSEMKVEMKLRGLYVDEKGLAPEEPEVVRNKLGLSQEQWDALPNQPPSSNYWKGIREAPIIRKFSEAISKDDAEALSK